MWLKQTLKKGGAAIKNGAITGLRNLGDNAAELYGRKPVETRSREAWESNRKKMRKKVVKRFHSSSPGLKINSDFWKM